MSFQIFLEKKFFILNFFFLNFSLVWLEHFKLFFGYSYFGVKFTAIFVSKNGNLRNDKNGKMAIQIESICLHRVSVGDDKSSRS